MSDRLDEVLESPEAERLATGYNFTEGPVWHPDGYLWYTDSPRLFRLRPGSGNGPELMRNNSGGANGMTLDLQGRLVMCEGLNRRVTRTDRDGSITPIAVTCRGRRLSKPNDVVFRSDGTMYFTDPGSWPYSTTLPDIEGNFVYRVTPDGEVMTTTPFEYPNGLAFSPDEGILYVDNTRYFKHISAFDVRPDGSLTHQRVFAELPQRGEPGVPDGMKVDQDGRVYCTGPGGLWVFDASGEFLGKIRLPELPANCGWGDDDNRTLYITARTSVYRMRMKTPGTMMPGAT